MKIILFILIFTFCYFVAFPQKQPQDTLWSISSKVYWCGSKEIKSKNYYVSAVGQSTRFYYNFIYMKNKKTSNACNVDYSMETKGYAKDYQEKLNNGMPLEQADSFILWKLNWFVDNYNEDEIFSAWYFYEKVLKFDKLQGKHHYIDYALCLQNPKQIDHNKHWNIDNYDTILVCNCKIQRYLLVDSVIYSFTTSTLKHYKNRKKALRIAKRNFKKFIRCIWIKEEED